MADLHTVATIDAIPAGQCRGFEVAGRRIVVYNVGGTFHATTESCLHRGGPLSEGDLEGEIITCPWHAWQWNVRTGQNPRNPSVAIETYPVAIEGNDLKVAL